MKTYGLPRNYNATEDFQNGGAARRRTTQVKLTNAIRRRARRTTRRAILVDFVAYAESLLSSTPFNDDLRIIEPFLHFPAGTSEAAILDWIDQLKLKP